jgi:hypothetical protein
MHSTWLRSTTNTIHVHIKGYDNEKLSKDM